MVTFAEFRGTSVAVDEGVTIYEALGSVSSTTWSKVQAEATDLHVIQALALENIHALADEVEATGATTIAMFARTPNGRSSSRLTCSL